MERGTRSRSIRRSCRNLFKFNKIIARAPHEARGREEKIFIGVEMFDDCVMMVFLGKIELIGERDKRNQMKQ